MNEVAAQQLLLSGGAEQQQGGRGCAALTTQLLRLAAAQLHRRAVLGEAHDVPGQPETGQEVGRRANDAVRPVLGPGGFPCSGQGWGWFWKIRE